MTITIAQRDYLLKCLGQASVTSTAASRAKLIALLNALSDDRKEGKWSHFHNS